MAEPSPLLNVYEVQTPEGTTTSVLCFLDPVLAGIRGIDPRSVLGLYGTGDSGEFSPETFRVNPAFVEALTGYMNDEAAGSAEVASGAKDLASGWLFIVDPRDPASGDEEPSKANILGAFAVDEAGQVVPGSFQYNEGHALFDREHGASGLLRDRKFYGWLHGIE